MHYEYAVVSVKGYNVKWYHFTKIDLCTKTWLHQYKIEWCLYNNVCIDIQTHTYFCIKCLYERFWFTLLGHSHALCLMAWWFINPAHRHIVPFITSKKFLLNDHGHYKQADTTESTKEAGDDIETVWPGQVIHPRTGEVVFLSGHFGKH